MPETEMDTYWHPLLPLIQESERDVYLQELDLTLSEEDLAEMANDLDDLPY